MKALVTPPLIATLLLAGCVSRSAPVRPGEADEVQGTRARVEFTVPASALGVLLGVREYLRSEGMSLVPAPDAERVEARHPFLPDHYRVRVEERDSGARVVLEGEAPGRVPALGRRVEELARGLREFLSAGAHTRMGAGR
jgi:hypothetical protein